MMKSNSDLQIDVKNAIKWEPLLKNVEINVTAKNGIIFLKGTVDSYAKKIEAEKAAKRVIGVKAVVEEIEVKFISKWIRNDSKIAEEVINVLNANWLVPKHKIKATVDEGWITLNGQLVWNYQRDAAKNALIFLEGVTGITNNIKIISDIQETIEQKDVENAIARCWTENDNEIHVKVFGTSVTLTGTVNSWFQKEDAGRIAWKTPGIWHVKNELVIDHFYSLVDPI